MSKRETTQGQNKQTTRCDASYDASCLYCTGSTECNLTFLLRKGPEGRWHKSVQKQCPAVGEQTQEPLQQCASL